MSEKTKLIGSVPSRLRSWIAARLSASEVTSSRWMPHFLLWIFLIGTSLTFNMRNPFPYFYFFADSATYYAMGYSLAFDGDLMYTRHDLERICREWPDGPTGIFLKQNARGEITYGKSFLYPLIAAPAVRLFGTNGFLFVNLLSIGIMINLAFWYLRRFMIRGQAFLFALTFIMFSTTWLYAYWIHPEVVVMCCVMTGLSVWICWQPTSPGGETVRLTIIALSLGMATFGKVTNAIFFLPPGLELLFRGSNALINGRFSRPILRRTIPVVLLTCMAALVLFGLFSFNKSMTGDWNYQWGERKGFSRQFPLETKDQGFKNTGNPATREGLAIKPDVSLMIRNCWYFFTGRFSGLIPYFPVAFLILVLFLLGKREVHSYLVAGALCAQQLFFFIFLTDNYFGGMGAIGNRYFLNAYPAFLFLLNRRPSTLGVVMVIIIASFSLGPMLINPAAHGQQPAEHAFAFPYNYLPVELSQVDFLPVHINQHLSRRELPIHPPCRVTFLDYQTWLIEGDGIWIRPGRAAQMLVETQFAASDLVLTVENKVHENEIGIWLNGRYKRLLMQPNERRSLRFLLTHPFQHNDWFVHHLSVRSRRGFIPRFHEESSTDKRYLGCLVRLEFTSDTASSPIER